MHEGWTLQVDITGGTAENQAAILKVLRGRDGIHSETQQQSTAFLSLLVRSRQSADSLFEVLQGALGDAKAGFTLVLEAKTRSNLRIGIAH